jgi:prepilin-type N-terminal cleavage/methylation domain-containing protein
MKKKLNGFTLVEIMIVVSIIGLLLAIALPNFLKARRKSFIRTAQASLKQIEGAYEQFLLDGGTAVVAITEVESRVTPDYVKVWPTCPGGGLWNYVATGRSNVFTATINDINSSAAFSAYDTVIP